jgi:hypothetical protein
MPLGSGPEFDLSRADKVKPVDGSCVVRRCGNKPLELSVLPTAWAERAETNDGEQLPIHHHAW